MNLDSQLLAALPFPLRVEIEENVIRKDFTQTELADIQRAVIAHWSASPHKHQGLRNSVPPSTSTKDFVEVAKPRRWPNTTQKVAELFGESEPTVRRRMEVVDAAREDPERYGTLLQQMDRTGHVSGVYRRMCVLRQAKAIAEEPPPLPEGPFRVIVADPPWASPRDADPSRRGPPYPTMSLDDIRGLNVAGIAADDSILWLWTTNTHLCEAFTVLDAWGFHCKTMLTWVKPHMGTGEWLRGRTEHCLLSVRGQPAILLTNQTTVLEAASSRHSEKPDEFYALVETLCPGSKVELFARKQREGWCVHGNEV